MPYTMNRSAGAIPSKEQRLSLTDAAYARLKEEILDTIAEGLIVADAGLRVVFVNAEALGLLGFQRADQLTGRRWEDVFRRRGDRQVRQMLSARAEPDAGAAQASPDTAPATEPPAPKEPAEDLGKMTVLPFTFGKASAQPDLTDDKRLGQLLVALRGSAARIEVGGHTSNEGAESYNQELGRSRAEAVRDLLARRGIPRARIDVRSYGGTVPIASNATEEGRRKNRRVTVRLRP